MRAAAVISVLVWLAACDRPPEIMPLIRADLQDIGFAEPALTRSVNALEGSNGGTASGGSHPTGNDRSTSDTLDNFDFEIDDLHEIALGLAAHLPRHRGARIGLRLLAGRGRAEIHLPDGVDVLVEPITVTAETRFLELALTLEQIVPWPGFLSDRLALSAEAGQRQTVSKVELRSPLIRRDDTGTDDQVYYGAGVRLRLGQRRKASIDLGFRRIEDDTTIGRVGLERRF